MSILSILKSGKKDTSSKPESFYDLKAKTIDGEEFNFSSLKGKKVLIVNVASKCGFTPQYEELERLYKEFSTNDFLILGFPSNDFLRQESGTEQEIKAFCQLTYGVSFPMMQKVKVKGNSKHEVYRWLTSKSINGISDSKVKWNFQKYMINHEGALVGFLAPRVSPYDKEILDFIKS